MTWLLILVVVLLVGGLAAVKLTHHLVSVFRTNLLDLLKAIKDEKDAVQTQRALLAADMIGMNMRAKKIDDTQKRVQNSIETVKALATRIHDPSWMNKFEEGRKNAPYN